MLAYNDFSIELYSNLANQLFSKFYLQCCLILILKMQRYTGDFLEVIVFLAIYLSICLLPFLYIAPMHSLSLFLKDRSNILLLH